MRNLRCNWLLLLLSCWAMGSAQAAAGEGFLLRPNLPVDVTTTVTIALEMGGDLLTKEAGIVEKQPVSVAANLVYNERLVKWTPDAKETARSIRRYQEASATIKVEDNGYLSKLPEHHQTLAAEIHDGYVVLDTMNEPLTREQFDLVNVKWNSLAMDRLLPEREVAEGESWDHDKATIAPLLDMDHVAVCEVRSVVTGESHNQVQIRLAGTVHGTVDGAPTEMDLRGAYLFHLGRQRITKFNLAIKERRTATEIVPGLDTVAQLKLTVTPASKQDQVSRDALPQAANTSQPLSRTLKYEDREHGYRFLYDTAWYIRAEQTDRLSLRHLQEGEYTTQCNLSTLPPRSKGRDTTLEQYERDVRASIGDPLEKVTAARQWTTSNGNSCLGIVAEGRVQDVPVQWRYYLISAPDLPRVSISLSLEQSMVEKFADADRQLIDTMKLLPLGSGSTATRRPGPVVR